MKDFQVNEVSVDGRRWWSSLLAFLLAVVEGCFVSDWEENLVMNVNLFLFFLQWIQRSNFSIYQHGCAFNCCLLEVLVKFMLGIKDLELIDGLQGKFVSQVETFIPVFQLRGCELLQVKCHWFFGVPSMLMLNFFEPFVKMIRFKKKQELIIVIELILGQEVLEFILKLFWDWSNKIKQRGKNGLIRDWRGVKCANFALINIESFWWGCNMIVNWLQYSQMQVE